MKHMKAKHTPMKSLTLIAASVALLALSGCASTTRGIEGTDNQQASRITDERILADRQSLESLQSRLKVLNDAGVPVKSYTHAKAQCWLDTAKTQYHENDRTGYVEEAMGQSNTLIRSLEANKSATAPAGTAMIANSERLREDLWKRFDALKTKPGFSCVEQIVACNEVRLVRAGHANQQTGWRQASPHIAMVEDALKVAERDEAACKRPTIVPAPAAVAPVAPPPPVVVAPAPAPVPAPAPMVTTQRLVLMADALFHYDQYSLQHMLPEGKARIREAVSTLKSYSRIDQIGVYGYTDRVGTDEYNTLLSQRRADTVKAYLQSLGVNAPVMVAQGRGKSLTKSDECRRGMPLKQLAPCLQPDRKVELEVTGILQ
jgi:OmpA-OmpF porin, OOP family